MIDTNKYEGHTDDYIWTWKHYASHFDHDADRALIQDAPLLLEEVKRLRVLLNGIVDIALKQMSLNDDNPPMGNILNIAYEGVVK